MTRTTTAMLRSILMASAAAASLAAPGLAHAQPGTASPAVDVSEIVVTGSRIRRPDLSSIQPLQVISSESIDQRGFTNVADAINELPSMGVPVNPIGDQGSFGTGRNFINLFALGTNRTLVLVNGRRFVGGNPASIFTGANAGQQVDLNTIPTGIIDRIETVQAGGSAVYGSDAISGVVNIITKRAFDGIELDGQYGVSEHGDGEQYRARILAGRNFLDDRLSAYGSYEYSKTTALASTDREPTALQLNFAANPANRSSTDGIPGAILIENRRVPEVTLGGIPFAANTFLTSRIVTIPDPANPGGRVAAAFAPDGTLVPYSVGTFFSPSVASGGDGLNLGQLSSLQSPVERHIATAFGTYKITDNIRAKAELYYLHLDSTEPFNQPIFNTALFGGASGNLRMSTANPFLSAQARAALLAQPTPLPADPSSPGDAIFFLSRASLDIGSNRTHSEGDTYRGVFGLEGDFDWADRHFFWDASFNRGRNKGFFESPNIVQTNFAFAVDAIRDPATGQPVCRDPAARAAGCQPLNLFGVGAPSQAALQYVGVTFRSDYAIDQIDYIGNFGGDIWKLPGGTASFVVGGEWRKESSNFRPNDPQRLGVGRSAPITALSGSFTTKEYYGEALVPIFGKDFNFFGVRSLEIEGQWRRVDNSQAGKNNAWSYGARWRPFEDLLIRGSKSRSFRAPAVVELFLPQATAFFNATDPCDFRNITSGPNPAARQANCQADFQRLGLPANFQLTSQVQAATVQGFSAGSPDLRNEIADQETAGFVYQPHFAPGLSIKFDWMKVNIKDAISNFNLTSILQVCYDLPNHPADVCDRFQRGLSTAGGGARAGQILNSGEDEGNGTTAAGALTGFVNAGFTNFEGSIAGLYYNLDLADVPELHELWSGDPGRLELSLDYFHINKLETSVTGLGFDLHKFAGEIGQARNQYRAQAHYQRDPLGVTWTTRYIGRSVYNTDFTLETRFPLSVKEYFLNDLAITYDVTGWVGHPMGLSRLQARLIVNNVFDVEPPFGATTSANGIATYDLMGRFYEVGLNARF